MKGIPLGLLALSAAGVGVPIAGPMATVAQAATAAPLLWKGIVKNAAGVPTAGSITVSARPPGTSGKLLPVAKVTSAVNGAYEITLPWSAALDGYKDQNGNITFVAQTFAGSEVNIATNSMRYLAAEGVWTNGGKGQAYENIKAARVAQGVTTSAVTTDPSLQGLLAVDATDVTTQGPGPSTTPIASLGVKATPTPSAIQLAANQGLPVTSAGPPPAGECVPWTTAYLPDSWMIVGTLFIEPSWAWSNNTIKYARANTTETSVGFTASGSGVWGVSGKTTMGSSEHLEATGSLSSSVNIGSGRKYAIWSSNKLIEWRCWNHPGTPPPATPHLWGQYWTLEKEGWINHFNAASRDNQIPACNGERSGVAPGGRVTRSDGASELIAVGFTTGFPGNGAFAGSVEASIQNTGSSSVSWSWGNISGTPGQIKAANKYVCGIGGNAFHGRGAVPVAQAKGDFL